VRLAISDSIFAERSAASDRRRDINSPRLEE